jgi:hypothetical protein
MHIKREELDQQEDRLEVLKEEFLKELTADELKLVAGGDTPSESAQK